MQHSVHPTTAQLQSFARGELTEEVHDDVERHVLHCDQCTELIATVELDLPTEWVAAASEAIDETISGLSSDAPNSEAAGQDRFVPGMLLSGRYRIVSSLGRGAMGEVYRADDTKLGQTVALKFLAPQLRNINAAVELFHREVRLARQVTHPNVCRVYDIGEFEGNLFLSMEYIDGEDLETLLERLGKIPEATALNLVSEMCAGLAAAHECEVLHRDLKPANVMIDSLGRIRITDFGLACLAPEGSGVVAAGTPAYMAPEQLLKGETSVQSDLYSVGLIAYEIFTGRRLHRQKKLKELREFHREAHDSNLPEDELRTLPPVIAKLIRRCLQREPVTRPASVAEVARDLPVRTALSIALERGETPTPEIVAEGVGDKQVSPKLGLVLYTTLLLTVVLLAARFGRLGGVIHEPVFPRPRAELEQLAREVLTAAGYDQAYSFSTLQGQPFVDEAVGFLPNPSYPSVPYGLAQSRLHTPFRFWFRASPEYLSPESRLRTAASWSDPKLSTPGEVRLMLDTFGRLVHFEVHSPEHLHQDENRPINDWDWDPFFREPAIEVDKSQLQTAEPGLVPTVNYDRLVSWETKQELRDAEPVRIDAAEFQGRPVYFSVSWPRDESTERLLGPILQEQTHVIRLGMLVLAAIFAPINLYRNRSDRHGALLLAINFYFAVLCVSLIGAHYTDRFSDTSQMALVVASRASFVALMMWLYYVALEPTVRRFWPTMLITWTRLMRGKFTDPLVARDILVGLLAGCIGQAFVKFTYFFAERNGITLDPYYFGDATALVGGRFAFANLTNCYLLALSSGLFAAMFLFALRLPLQTKGIASVIFVIFHTAQLSLGSEETFTWAINLIFWTTVVLLLTRFGLVALIAFLFVSHCVMSFPFPATLNSWYLTTAMLPLLAVLLIATFALYCLVVPTRQAKNPFSGSLFRLGTSDVAKIAR